MIEFSEINPVAFELGPLKVHWYGLSYITGIGLGWIYLRKYVARYLGGWPRNSIDDLVFYCSLGAVLGGRVGYVLFYDFPHFLLDPISIFEVWKGGMSFHGGMLGVLLAMYFFARKLGRGYFEVTDFIAPVIPLGLGSGRIGNFINSELPGRVTDVPWAVVYPNDVVGRHPSSLYQAMLEGPVLFLLLWWFASRRPARPTMAVSGMFCVGYGALRVLSECFREPDAHLSFVAFDFLTMGQLLSFPLVLFGVALLVLARREQT